VNVRRNLQKKNRDQFLGKEANSKNLKSGQVDEAQKIAKRPTTVEDLLKGTQEVVV
jgi:hypothetical protein